MGVDPGIAALGYGLVASMNGRLSVIAHGCLRTESDEPMGKRLAYLFHEIRKLIRQFAPDVGGIEELYFLEMSLPHFLLQKQEAWFALRLKKRE